MEKHHWNSIILNLLTLCVLISCAKSPFTKQGTALRGTWIWVRTDGGFANHIHDTPASTGKNIKWVFSSANSYKIYHGDTLYSGGTYQLLQRECIHDHTMKKMIDFSTPTDQDLMIESQGGKTIMLSDEMFDGLGSEFVLK